MFVASHDPLFMATHDPLLKESQSQNNHQLKLDLLFSISEQNELKAELMIWRIYPSKLNL